MIRIDRDKDLVDKFPMNDLLKAVQLAQNRPVAAVADFVIIQKAFDLQS